MFRTLGLAVGLLLVGIPARAGTQSPAPDPDPGIAVFLTTLQQAIAAGQPSAYLALLGPTANRADALEFARANFGRPAGRVSLRERSRVPLEDAPAGEGYVLTIEALFDQGTRGRLVTWQIDVRRQAGEAPPGNWRISAQRELSSLDNLYRLALDSTRQYSARNLVVTAEDLELRLESGSMFVAGTDQGPTALVLVGRGEMVFSPAPASERGQIRILSGQDALREGFDVCFLRLNPGDLGRHLSAQPPSEPVDARMLRRAQAVFAAEAQHSYTLDLAELSPGPWSILPSPGDVVAEIHTRHHGALTYTRSMRDPEAIGLFDRAHRRYLALYSAKQTLASRGRFYSDDDQADYDVVHYDVSASFAPEREWIDGVTRLVLRVRAPSLSVLELKLAGPLAVRSVVGLPGGPLLAVRVRDQDSVMVTLPGVVPQGSQLTLIVAYGGQLPPQALEPDANNARPVGAGPGQAPDTRSYLYGARSAWYPQPPHEQYATATVRVTVPAPYRCVASGRLVSVSKAAPAEPSAPPGSQFVFDTPRPLPYLACLIGEIGQVRQETIALPARPPAAGDGGDASLLLTVDASHDEQARAAQIAGQAKDIVTFYTSLLGDCPYPDLTVAVIERDLPGGHSPAYLAILDEQAATSRLRWQDDPASFPGFPEYFVAHEIAHQWWGEAVGGKNYHEEWLSEAFAQYFAALFAAHAHGDAALAAILHRMQQWTVRDSSQGPIYLGARVGQLKNDGQAVRAVVYDKGALVLHMLRRLIGDQAFFDGLRAFYRTWRFRNAGSDDLRKAFEAASGRPLDRFFERWVYGDTLPRARFSWQQAPGDGGAAVSVRFEQVGDVFDMPVSVTIQYENGTTSEVVVPVTDRVVVRRIPVAGRVKTVSVNRDGVVPADISR